MSLYMGNISWTRPKILRRDSLGKVANLVGKPLEIDKMTEDKFKTKLLECWLKWTSIRLFQSNSLSRMKLASWILSSWILSGNMSSVAFFTNMSMRLRNPEREWRKFGGRRRIVVILRQLWKWISLKMLSLTNLLMIVTNVPIITSNIEVIAINNTKFSIYK